MVAPDQGPAQAIASQRVQELRSTHRFRDSGGHSRSSARVHVLSAWRYSSGRSEFEESLIPIRAGLLVSWRGSLVLSFRLLELDAFVPPSFLSRADYRPFCYAQLPHSSLLDLLVLPGSRDLRSRERRQPLRESIEKTKFKEKSPLLTCCSASLDFSLWYLTSSPSSSPFLSPPSSLPESSELVFIVSQLVHDSEADPRLSLLSSSFSRSLARSSSSSWETFDPMPTLLHSSPCSLPLSVRNGRPWALRFSLPVSS